MKRTILTLSLLVLTVSAGAWNKTTYATIMTLASKRLSPEVKSAVQKSLGGEFATAIISDKEAMTFSVDETFVPLRNNENDALVVVERSISRLRGDKNDTEALLSLAKAIADLHSVPSLSIKDNIFSNENYIVRRWNNREGRLARYTKVKWRAMWNSYFPGRHYLFTPEMYAYDIDLYHSRYAMKFVEGELSAWVEDVVKEYRAIYAENLAENHILTQERVNEYEYIHDRLMAKAGYRLAALLNQILK
jgi:hypothetical protein